jgi:hypothetical protein
MIIDIRNEYGFPVPTKLDVAKQYAAEAKERNKLPCDCETCRMKELEPAVVQLVRRWSTA